MFSGDTKILEFNEYHHKSETEPFIIYADFESLIENIDVCKNSSKNSSITKVSEHIPSGCSMPTISSFKSIENKHDVFRVKDCVKKFCKSLRKHAVKIIDFKKIEIINKQNRRHHIKMQKFIVFAKKNLKTNMLRTNMQS